MDPAGFGEIGLEELMRATREFGEVRISELKSSKSDRGEVKSALFLERWLAECNGLTIDGNQGVSLIPELRYGESELGGGMSGDGLASSKSVLLPAK